MHENDLFKARHSGTGIISSIPKTYLDIYPGVYEVMSASDLAQHYQEVEEDKIVYALDAAEKPAKHAATEEGE